MSNESVFGEQILAWVHRLFGMGAGGGPPQRGQITALGLGSRREGGRMGNLLFWLGIGAAQKGAGSMPSERNIEPPARCRAETASSTSHS
jgi:hypothetical protein